MKMMIPVSVFDEIFKTAFSIFLHYFVKLVDSMDTPIDFLKEPVLEDLLPKNTEIEEDSVVLQERHVLWRNSKDQIPNLEQQFAKLKSRIHDLENRWDAQKNVVSDYEQFYSKVTGESARLMREKQENEMFCKDLMERHEKSREMIEQYEQVNTSLNTKVLEYEETITSLTEECAKLKEYIHAKLEDNESKNSLKLLIKNKVTKEYSKSMFEPLKGLDK